MRTMQVMEMCFASAGERAAGGMNAGEIARMPEKIKLKALIPKCEA